MASVYDVGTRAWQPDAAEGWVASELVDKAIEGDKAKLTFKLENGEVSRHGPRQLSSNADQAFHCVQDKVITVPADALVSGNDPALPPLMNPTMLEASDDLTNLSHL